jgi:hypothetical protein
MLDIKDERARGLDEFKVNGVHYARVRRPDIYANNLLHDENEGLRAALAATRTELTKALERHSLILPRACDSLVRGLIWEVPILVGNPTHCLLPPVGAPDYEPACRGYRLRFERVHTDRGWLWHSLPFTTEPDRA